MQKTKSLIQVYPKYLWFLTLSYTVIIVLANWFDARLIHITGLDTDAGTLIFPLTFLLSDLITEVYGYKHARRAIWCGFLFNIVFILYGQLVIHLPSPAYPTNNSMFDTVLSMSIRIIIASTISYFIAEPMNSYIMAKLKVKMHGRHLGLRFIASTVAASGLDSFIFTILAFYNIMSNHDLLALILTMWFIKVCIEVVGLTISIPLVKKLKQAEQLDIYDNTTDFNIFSLNANYSDKDNDFTQGQYKRHS